MCSAVAWRPRATGRTRAGRDHRRGHQVRRMRVRVRPRRPRRRRGAAAPSARRRARSPSGTTTSSAPGSPPASRRSGGAGAARAAAPPSVDAARRPRSTGAPPPARRRPSGRAPRGPRRRSPARDPTASGGSARHTARAPPFLQPERDGEEPAHAGVDPVHRAQTGEREPSGPRASPRSVRRSRRSRTRRRRPRAAPGAAGGRPRTPRGTADRAPGRRSAPASSFAIQPRIAVGIELRVPRRVERVGEVDPPPVAAHLDHLRPAVERLVRAASGARVRRTMPPSCTLPVSTGLNGSVTSYCRSSPVPQHDT